MVQWLGLYTCTAEGPGLIPGWRTKVLHKPHGVAPSPKIFKKIKGGPGESSISRTSIEPSTFSTPPSQAQAGPETSQETQSQQPGYQLNPNPTPSPLDASPRRPPGPATSPTSSSISSSISSPGKGWPGGRRREGNSSVLLQLLTASPASAFQVSVMISSPASSQVGGGPVLGAGLLLEGTVLPQGWSAPAHPAFAVHRGGPGPAGRAPRPQGPGEAPEPARARLPGAVQETSAEGRCPHAPVARQPGSGPRGKQVPTAAQCPVSAPPAHVLCAWI